MVAFLTPARTKSAIYVVLGQAGTVSGTLVGLRVTTEVIDVASYGLMVLTLGVITLVGSLLALPWLQAALRFWVDFESEAEAQTLLRQCTTFCLGLAAVVGLVVAAVAQLLLPWLGWRSVLIGLGLMLVDVIRTAALAHHSARGHFGALALLSGVDGWARPLLGAALAFWIEADADWVLLGHLLAGAVAALLLKGDLPLRPVPLSEALGAARRLANYAVPLTALPGLAWVTAQADRYIIAALLGATPAGIYAALYGLASRPFGMLSQAAELIIRQGYYAAVAADDEHQARHLLRTWLALVVAGSALLVAAVALLHDAIAYLALAAQYRSYAQLMIPIAVGYALSTVTSCLERVLYARKETRPVTILHSIGAVTSMACALPAIWWWGLLGAVFVVPVYFGIQLLLTVAFVRRRRG